MDGITVSWISDKKERGVIAARDFDEGEVLFSEEPMVSAQYLFNKLYFPACDHCLACLETPAEQAKRLSGRSVNVDLWGNDAINQPFVAKYPCSRGCEELYCSEECRDAAWTAYHSLLCVGPEEAPSSKRAVHQQIIDEWKSFHFPPESATISLLLKQVAMMIVADNEHLFDAHFKADKSNSSLKIAAKFLDEQFARRVDVFAQLFHERFAGLGRIEVSRDMFERVMTVVALNGQGIGTSAFEVYDRRLRSMIPAPHETDAIAAALEAVDELRAEIEEHSDEFTHAEGTGLYRTHAMLNHACGSNAQIEFTGNSHQLSVRATRPIRQGEEVTISYMDFCCDEEEEEDEMSDVEEEAHAAGSSSAHHYHIHHHAHSDDNEEDDNEDEWEDEDDELAVNVHERRKQLKEYYLFECECQKCLQELGQL
ncbi:hypothetical protein BC828DRAFT_374310 [Blastocladiella britannica]|nr:hypothetical protein BC828DRAFT_374310 [Blastocladiella britannica]